MIERFFDFEVLPHWWLCVLGDYPKENKNNLTEEYKETFTVINSDMPNARELLIEKLTEKGYVVVGYNIKNYDLVIANAIYNGFTPEQVKIINDLIIIPYECRFKSKEHIRLTPFAKKKFKSCVYQDMCDDDNGGSLKDKEGVLGLNILESSVDFNKEDLTQEDKDELTYYCKHDVWSTMIYYRDVREVYVNTKLAVGNAFNIPDDVCYKNTNANLCGIVLNAKRTKFADEFKDNVELPEAVKKYVYDALPTKMVNEILNNPYIIDDKGSVSSKTLTYKLCENELSFGNGGLHSVLSTNLYVEENEEWCLVNADGASFYPSLLIFQECLSRASQTPWKFKEIYEKRLAIKHKKDKTPEENELQLAYKLVLNTTFGASGNKYLDLYDRYQCIKTCRLGQILLAALSNKLYTNVNGLKVIQTNTDGVLIYFRRKDFDKVKEICNEWANVTHIGIDYDYVKKIWQRDVNNYILVAEENGKIKTKIKGAWCGSEVINWGYATVSGLSAPIASIAARNYLLEGKDICETILGHKNLYDFSMYCKKGPTYSRVVQKFNDGTPEKTLFRGNRVIASKDEKLGMLYKIKMYKGNLSYAKFPNIPEHCLVVNEDMNKYSYKELKKQIDFMFYVTMAVDKLDIDWTTCCNYVSQEKLNSFKYE